MKKLCALLMALALLVACLAAAGAEDAMDYAVLVYLCGTDLETRGGAATDDMIEMLEAGLPDDGSVCVLLQTGGTKRWRNELVDSSTAQRFLIADDIYTVSEDLGQLDMGDPDTLADFVRFALDELPAERYALVLWDHGSGAAGGVCYDELTGNALSAQDIHDALAWAGGRFEFIGFDACLMSTLEMAACLQPFADYMIASEELEPGIGWAYDAWLGELAVDPWMDGEQIGRVVVDSFIESALAADPNDYVTLSVTDLTALDAVIEAANELGDALGNAMETGRFAHIARARAGMRAFGDFMDVGSDMVDVAALAGEFAKIAPGPSRALERAVGEAVVYSRNSANVESASGLSILLPLKTKSEAGDYLPEYDPLDLLPDYAAFMDEYVDRLLGGDHSFSASPIQAQPLDVSDAQTASWLQGFVQGIQMAQGGAEPEPMDEQDLAQVAESFGNVAYTVRLSQGDLDSLSYAEASLLQDAQGQVSDEYGEDVYFDFGLVQDTYVDWDSGTVYGLFDGNWPTLEGQMVPMYDQIVTERYTRSVVPARVNDLDQYLLVVFNDENPQGLVVGYSEGYDENGNPARGYERLRPGDAVAPLFELIYWDENDEMYSETYVGEEFYVGEQPPEFGYDEVESGDYSYALCLNDVYGGYEYTDFWSLDCE